MEEEEEEEDVLMWLHFETLNVLQQSIS